MWYRETEGPWFKRAAILGTFIIQFFWREEFGVLANNRIIYLWQRREPQFNLPWVSVLDICIYIHKHYRYDICIYVYICMLLFSCQVMSNSLWSHGLQHSRLLCPSLSPRVCANLVHGVAKSWTRLSDFTFTFTHFRRKWQPTPVFLPGESQGWGSLVGCHLWDHTESDPTEVT